jgi:pSer/pThr/pTyr-binding forkhead associated (FHA) protein
MPSNYELLIEEDDPALSKVVQLGQSALSIGRKPGNTILLDERNVSRYHARLVRAGDAVEIEDLNSYTGVLLNGQRLSGRALLHEGDQVRIGDYRLALRRVVQAAAAAPAQTVLIPLPEPPVRPAAPVRDPQPQRLIRRVWLILTMGALGLLGGLLLNRQGPGPRSAPVSARALQTPRAAPPPAPPLPVQGKPAAPPADAQAKPQSATASKLRRRSALPQLPERRAVPAGSAEAPAVAAPGPSSASGEARLAEAQTLYINGEFAAAIRAARGLTTRPEPGVSSTRVWRLLGAAACHLGDLELLNEAYRRVDPVARQYLQYVCERAHVTRSGGRFELAR